MAEKKETVQGVDISNPTGSFAPGYEKSDLERLYYDAKPTSWPELVHFLDTKGDAQWHLTPGEVVSIRDDIQQLIDHRVPFTSDPAKAYAEAHKYRAKDVKKEEPGLHQARG